MQLETQMHTSAVHRSAPVSRAQDEFQRLVADLSDILGPVGGINTEDINASLLLQRMEKYISREGEWHQYAFGDSSQAYTRNLVDKGNANSNLVSVKHGRVLSRLGGVTGENGSDRCDGPLGQDVSSQGISLGRLL